MGKQPDYSWQVSPTESKQCSCCGGTGRVRMETPDPLSLLEWEKAELLRKLDKCHNAMRDTLVFLGTCHAPCTGLARKFGRKLTDAMTDRGGASVCKDESNNS